MTRTIRVTALLLVLCLSHSAFALIGLFDKGVWPSTWPKELEPLRTRSKTLDVATGTQEHVYTIPFEDRDEFEKFWPVFLKVRTPGSPLTLSLTVEGKIGHAGFLPSDKPCVRIKGPTGAYSGGTATVGGQIDLKQLKDGTMLFCGAPWPEELIGPKGELPEYVMSIKQDDGKLAWKAVDETVKKRHGFHNRARVDIELVIDGDVIDLNRIALPEDALLIDRRFPASAEK